MEESKELQGFYRIFRAVVYVSVLMEFFEYAIDPAMLDHWGGILCEFTDVSSSGPSITTETSCTVRSPRCYSSALHV